MACEPLYPADLAKARIGRKHFQPSNGTEGCMFRDRWCDQCMKEKEFRDTDGCEGGCEIVNKTMIFDVTDDEYPPEWTYGKNGQPCCTAWEADPDEVEPEPDPDQMELKI